jgi:hypothetical protein
MFLESDNGVSGNSLHAFLLEMPLQAILASIMIAVLRLRRNFATQSSDSAQDDSSTTVTAQLYDDKLVSVSRIPGLSYFAASTYTAMRFTPSDVGAKTYQRFSCSTNAKK